MNNAPKKIKVYDKRFGNIAIEKGFLTLDELINALEIQVQEEIKKGERRLIGQILLEQKVMTSDQIKEVLSDIFGEESDD
jgi:hypothetical protein